MAADGLGLGAGLGLLSKAGRWVAKLSVARQLSREGTIQTGPSEVARARSRTDSDRSCPARWRRSWRLHLGGAGSVPRGALAADRRHLGDVRRRDECCG